MLKKNLLRTLFGVAVVAAIYSFNIKESVSFEGSITYNVTVDAPQMPPEAKGMFANSTMTTYHKGDKSRTEMMMGMMKTIVIADNKTGIAVSLMDMQGQKIMMKHNMNEKDKDETATYEIKYLNDSKTIAGYACKKAEIIASQKDGSKRSMFLWYNPELPWYKGNQSQFKGLKGCPLEFEFIEQGMTIKMIGQSVSKAKVDDAKFIIPEGYKEMKKEDLMKGMQRK